MNFFDDIKMRVEQSGNAVVNDLKAYYEQQVVTPLVRVGLAATGNLSEAQIRAGQVAAAPPIAPPQNGLIHSGMGLVSLLALGTIAYVIFSPSKVKAK